MKTVLILVGVIFSTMVSANVMWDKFEGCYSVMEVDGVPVNQDDFAFSFKKSEVSMFVDEKGEEIPSYSLMFEINESELLILDIFTNQGDHRVSGDFTEFSYSGVQYYRLQPEIPFDVETKAKLRMLNDSKLELHYYNYFSAQVGRLTQEYSLKATFEKVDSSECDD